MDDDSSERGARSPGLLRNLGYLLGSTAVIRAGGFVFALLIRRVLGPEETGVWNLIDILVAYMMMATVGVTFSAERLIPGYDESSDGESLDQLRNAIFTWTLIEAGALTVGAQIYVLMASERFDDPLRSALVWLPSIYFIQKVLSLHLMVLRSLRHFRAYSLGTVVNAVLEWSLILWAAAGGLTGVLCGFVVVGLIKIAWFRYAIPERALFGFRWRASLVALRGHLRYGLRYGTFKALFTLGERIDSLVVGTLIGTTALGWYYIGFQFSRMALEIPVALSYITFPELMAKWVKGSEAPSASNLEDGAQAFRGFLRLELFLIVPCLLPAVYFGSELVIKWFLPDFAPGIPAVKITLSAVGIMAVRLLYYQVLTAFDKLERLVLAIAAQVAGFFVLALLLTWTMESRLLAVAVANALAYCIHLLALIALTEPLLAGSSTVSRYGWAVDVFALAGWSALLLGVDLVFDAGNASRLGTAALQTAGAVAMYYLIAAPVALLGLGSQRAYIVAGAKDVARRRFASFDRR